MDASPPFSPPRTVALVGLMGAGKSAIGKRLALRLGLPFVDADEEIERAMERDKFFSPPEAKEFGLIDEVLENRPVPTVAAAAS